MNASKHKDFKCHNCDMVFPSYALLQKHKASYCIGRAKNPMFERSSSSRSGFSSSSYMVQNFFCFLYTNYSFIASLYKIPECS